MISHLGYSSTECMGIPISVGRITLQCPNGKIGRIFDYGVNVPETGSPIDACLNNNLISDCRPDSAYFKGKLDASKGSEFHGIDFSLGNLYYQ